MATYTERREPLVTCPYNPAHQVKKGRLQIHVTKCRKAYPEKDMKHCPFSAEHIVPASELMHHIFTCPLNTTVERFLTASERDVPSGDVTVPPLATIEQHQQHEEPPEENWDADATGAVSLEDKIPAPAVAPVFVNVQAMAPAQRRSYYRSLHSVADELVPEDMRPHPVHRPRTLSPPIPDLDAHHLNMPRPPKTYPKGLADLMLAQKAAKAQYVAAGDESGSDDESDEEEEVDQGRMWRMGTGRGCVAASRVNASSNDEEDEEVRSRMRMLGLGRGLPLCRN